MKGEGGGREGGGERQQREELTRIFNLMRDLHSYIVSTNDLPDGTVNQDLYSGTAQYYKLQDLPPLAQQHYLRESIEHGYGDRLASGKKLLPDYSQQLHRAQQVLTLSANCTEGSISAQAICDVPLW